jgi:hypothetical protein
MADYDDFKKKDKSEKVTVLHIEPVRQLIRWTDEGGKRYSKLLTTPYTKTNSILIGMLRDQVALIDYNSSNFLEDDQNNPFLTDDDQFFFVEI